jgi:ABC-type lipoprotein release transport system permease subunit
VLIVAIMAITFLNLVATTGILVGLFEGSVKANREQFTGDIFVSELPTEGSIENSSRLLSTIADLGGVVAYSPRYISGATIEANYATRRDFQESANSVGGNVVGINPEIEDQVTNLSEYIIDGSYLDSNRSGEVLIGNTLLAEYTDFSDIFVPLQNLTPGEKVRITVTNSGSILDGEGVDPAAPTTAGRQNFGSRTLEFTMVGVVDSKVGENSSRIFMTADDWRRLTGRPNTNINEVAIDVADDIDPIVIKDSLTQSGFNQFAEIETFSEAIPSFLNDIKITFGLLGNLIGSIGIFVASITIFIVIYINALTRRKYIGILKGIGITGRSIERAYLLQAIFYALLGVGLATVLIYAVLIPFVAANPIDFPFADGILVAEPAGTAIRAGIMLAVTAVAGFIPAWLIVRQNTLDSILGR